MNGAIVGKAKFKLHNASAVLTDLSDWLVKISAPNARDMLNSDTFDGSGSHGFTPGLRGGQEFTAEFLWHTTPFAVLSGVDALDNTSLLYETSPEGTASGKPKLSGQCYLKAFNPDASVGAIATMTATFQQTGAQTWGTN